MTQNLPMFQGRLWPNNSILIPRNSMENAVCDFLWVLHDVFPPLSVWKHKSGTSLKGR